LKKIERRKSKEVKNNRNNKKEKEENQTRKLGNKEIDKRK